MTAWVSLKNWPNASRRGIWLAALLAAGAGCTSSEDEAGDTGNDVSDANDVGDDGDGDGDGDGDTDDGFDDVGVPYERGSLTPIFRLPGPGDATRFTVGGRPLTDEDFTSLGNPFTSMDHKLRDIARQISDETGFADVYRTIVGTNETRTELIPFRGYPTDVDIVRVDGKRVVAVPLGGSPSVPGNEVALAVLGKNAPPRLIPVGIRPVRTAVHASGLVFVCNQYSSYLSILDASAERILVSSDGVPVEIATDYGCSDIAVAEPLSGDVEDRAQVYVANPWRRAVLRYDVAILRDGRDGHLVDVVRIAPPTMPAATPDLFITRVGPSPQRLRLSEDGAYLYVTGRGGSVARVSRADKVDVQEVDLGAPAFDLVQIGGSVFVPTTTRDRGLLFRGDPAPEAVQSDPAVVTGVDGAAAEVHPGARFDGTHAYGMEDVRNGVLELGDGLADERLYYTDDISPETNFSAEQKLLAGAVPIAAERDRAGQRLFLALSGSDAIQELGVAPDAPRLRAVPGGIFSTASRPIAMALDEEAGQLLVASWGSGLLEVFDLADRSRIERIDLGYAASYPDTIAESGEQLFFSAAWSNTGRKSCGSCHTEDTLTDGLSFSIGTTAPTALHQVPALTNLIETSPWGWSGGVAGNDIGGLEFRAMTRTNCELVLYGLVDGPAADPATFLGDPVVGAFSGGDSTACRTEPVDPATGLPANFADIAAEVARQRDNAARSILEATGLSPEEAHRRVAIYGYYQLRVLPNALSQLLSRGYVPRELQLQLDLGRAVYLSAGCGDCHTGYALYTDRRDHGSGAAWRNRLIERYGKDPRIDLTGFAADDTTDDLDPTVYQAVDFTAPFCFNRTSCLVFRDPIEAGERGDVAEETRRLDLLQTFFLADPDQRSLAVNVVGQMRVNTPSLRGVSTRTSLLQSGLGRSLREVILAPGHPALRPGERGLAVSPDGAFDVHGITSTLGIEEVEALDLFVQSLE